MGGVTYLLTVDQQHIRWKCIKFNELKYELLDLTTWPRNGNSEDYIEK